MIFYLLLLLPFYVLGARTDSCELAPEANLLSLESTVGDVKSYITLCNGIDACLKTGSKNPYGKVGSCKVANEELEATNYWLKKNKTHKCNLTNEELVALRFYANQGSSCMNTYLRSAEKNNPEINHLVTVLNQALSKLPDYQGIVVRGVNLPEEAKALHKKGAVVTYDSFTSTSTQRALWGTEKLIMISKTGKPIMGFVSNEEHEVLFKSGTSFKVLDHLIENGHTYYVMKEVSPALSDDDSYDQNSIKEVLQSSPKKTYDYWKCLPGKKPLHIQQKILPIGLTRKN